MGEEMFRSGKDLEVKRSGTEYELSIHVPADEGGMVARACPFDQCSPGYFKVKPGTGLAGPSTTYCPYCGKSGSPRSFQTPEQGRYAKDIFRREAMAGAERMLKEAVGRGFRGGRSNSSGLVSFKIEVKSKPARPVTPPAEEILRRDVICPHCALEHSVFGLATWCPDCGTDIFLAHVDAEFAVVRKMVGDADRRREALGPRVAAKDLENALEDTVSIFEAVLRIIVRRILSRSGRSETDVNEEMRGLGNAFQNVDRANDYVSTNLHRPNLGELPEKEILVLRQIFEKRHPITHNLGVVDAKYLARVQGSVSEGRDVLVTVEEIESAIAICGTVFASLYVPSDRREAE